MKEIIFNTDIYSFDTFREFVEEFQVDEQDLIITNAFILTDSVRQGLKADVICQEQYGAGETSDEMVEAMYGEISSMKPHKRIIGIGGGDCAGYIQAICLKVCPPGRGAVRRKAAGGKGQGAGSDPHHLRNRIRGDQYFHSGIPEAEYQDGSGHG